MHELDQHFEGDGSLSVPAAQATIDAPEGLALDYVKLIRKYGLLAAAMAIIGAAAGFLSVAVMTPEYKASALLEVQSANGGLLKMPGIPDDLGQVDLTTEAQILQSKTFLRQVVGQLQLENAPTPVQSDIFSKLRRILRGEKFEEGSVQQSVVGLDGLSNGTIPKALAIALLSLRAEPIERTHLIEVTCESPNPQLAADFLNALINQYIEHNYQARMDAVRSTTQWISGQLAEAKERMNQSDARLQEFMRNSGNAFVGTDDALGDNKLKDLQERLTAANADLIAKQTLYETVHKTPAEALPGVIDDSTVRSYQARISDLRREEASLTATLTSEHPKVKAVEAQIANLQTSLQKELVAFIKRVDTQYEAAKRTQDLMRKSYAAVAQQVASQTGKQAQYDVLKKESDSARESYQSLVLQANQANMAGSLPVNNVQPIDRAVPAELPYKPKPMMNIGAGLAAGLALCCGFAFLREKMDKRVTSLKQARQLFNLPQLGVIPSVGAEEARRLLPDPDRGRFAQSKISIVGPATPPAASLSPFSVTSTDPFVAESFRVTLASLMRESAGGRRPQVILVTSPGPEEGKTTIASNLGIALAETGRPVLILDADFRRPRIHKVFGIENGKGLVDLLEEDIPVAAYSRDVLGLKTFAPHLSVLPSGRQPQNVARILYSTRFRELTQRLRKEFDTILIDAPPMLNVADARVVSGMADGVVFVIRVGVTDKESAGEALEQLRSDGTVVLGTVLNDWKPSKAEARKRYYYGNIDSVNIS